MIYVKWESPRCMHRNYSRTMCLLKCTCSPKAVMDLAWGAKKAGQINGWDCLSIGCCWTFNEKSIAKNSMYANTDIQNKCFSKNGWSDIISNADICWRDETILQVSEGWLQLDMGGDAKSKWEMYRTSIRASRFGSVRSRVQISPPRQSMKRQWKMAWELTKPRPNPVLNLEWLATSSRCLRILSWNKKSGATSYPYISLALINTFASYGVETGSKLGWTMPKRAICSKISANKMPSGFCGSNFIISEAYLQPR